MSLVDRAKNILLQPAQEWEVIAKEPATVGGLFTGYAAILALIPVFFGLLGVLLMGASLGGAIGAGAAAAGFGVALGSVAIYYAVGLGFLYLMIIISKMISPSFNGSADIVQNAKLMVYATTPLWVAGVFEFVPGLTYLAKLAGFAYMVYLFYLGCKPVLSIPTEKVAGMTVVIALAYIVLWAIVLFVIIVALFSMVFGGAMMAGAATGM